MSPKDQTQPNKVPNQSGSNTINAIIISVILAVAISFLISKYLSPAPQIAYVDTAKLMVGFNEANKVDRELKEVDETWKKQLKELQDSLASHVNLMTREYDTSTPQKKKEFQDVLSAHNQRINNYREANNTKMQKLQQEKMKSI